MKQSEFTLLVRSGAIARVTIYRDAKSAGQWTVWAYGEEGLATGWARDWIEPARQQTARTWASLDTAHTWIRQQGWAGSVSIDDGTAGQAPKSSGWDRDMGRVAE